MKIVLIVLGIYLIFAITKFTLLYFQVQKVKRHLAEQERRKKLES